MTARNIARPKHGNQISCTESAYTQNRRTRLRDNEWERSSRKDVCLKSLNNSKDIKREILEEVKNQHKLGGDSAIAIYGITENPKDGNYMMVMEYAKQGSLRKLLDSRYDELDWTSKIANLYYIAVGLKTIHEAKLVHKEFHSGNIVNQNMFNSYITDF
ncbi:8419_t:CDS:2, partial [Cetraspora pellucida]